MVCACFMKNKEQETFNFTSWKWRRSSYFWWSYRIIKKHYTVYAVDSRGHGQSDKVLEYHYLDMAKDIQEMIEQLELKDISLMGSSDGAIIGLLIGSLYPKLVDHLILAGVNVKPNGVILEVYQEMKEQYQKQKSFN